MVFYSILADVVVVLHVAYIAFVVLGLVAILIGVLMRWQWVRNFWFRIVHLAMIGVVVVQALVGVLCPLTLLEQYLREKAGEVTYAGSFIGHWADELIFYDISAQAFTAIYCAFGAAVLATLLLAPPRWPRKKKAS